MFFTADFFGAYCADLFWTEKRFWKPIAWVCGNGKRVTVGCAEIVKIKLTTFVIFVRWSLISEKRFASWPRHMICCARLAKKPSVEHWRLEKLGGIKFL